MILKILKRYGQRISYALILGGAIWFWMDSFQAPSQNSSNPVAIEAAEIHPTPSLEKVESEDTDEHIVFYHPLSKNKRVSYWWNGVSEAIKDHGIHAKPEHSNIRLKDFVGSEKCSECHPSNYRKWYQHSHRRMNALAIPENVMGDFSGNSVMNYLGGEASFYRINEQYRMKLARDGTTRIYSVNRTIGSRFFQYYIGTLIDGPEPESAPIRKIEHVLPIGYWLEEKEWVPIVHVDDELPDNERIDPYETTDSLAYDRQCSTCHTTRPVGDWMLSMGSGKRMDRFSPKVIAFDVSAYINENHANTFSDTLTTEKPDTIPFTRIVEEMSHLPARQYASALGIGCEACHQGGRDHVSASTTTSTSSNPRFFPSSPHMYMNRKNPEDAWSRNTENVNWICSKCHSGSRPQFAAGMATWNSTEFSNAEKGFCYDMSKAKAHGKSSLTCIHCHDPHKGIGTQWSTPPEQDDQSCISCHDRFSQSEKIAAHTHHSPDSQGSRCMNCHMPKISEGMQNVTRTHMIFNPTHAGMIEANQPNACNLCHLDKPINWTLTHLDKWYDHQYDKDLISRNYPNPELATGLGWLNSSHEPTRLVAASALAERRQKWALPALINMLDDPFLLNRQFTQMGLENMLSINLRDLGYRFYQTKKERAETIPGIRDALLEEMKELKKQ